MKLLALELPALQLQVSIVDSMPELQCHVDADVSLSLQGRANLPWTL